MDTKRGVALTTPLTAPFKTVTSLILFLKNNRRPAKADGYFLALRQIVLVKTNLNKT